VVVEELGDTSVYNSAASDGALLLDTGITLKALKN
jgi:hypothetical protein